MLYLSGLCLIILIALAIIGEGSEAWFGGDQDAARRVVVPTMLLAAGGAFGFAMPWLFGFLARAVKRTIEAGGSQSGLASFAQGSGFQSFMGVAGWVACAAVLTFFIVFAYLFATGRITGA
ncbi:MAG: hypothetical protein AAF672_08675 [Pseudomonadota bacterium]